LDFSETLQAPTVNNGSNYDFRSAGPNGEFDDGDDVLYTVATTTAYGSGLSATYRVTDGPPQPGKYRFQAKTGLLDLYGNALTAVYTRTFTVVGVEGYVFESRSNNTLATATSMAASGGEGAGPGFTWRGGVEFEAGNNPIGVALADFDGDGKLDAVTSNYNGGNIGVMKGNGDGTFGAATLYASPNNPFHVAVADLNGDTKPDVVVTRYNGSAVMVFLNKNDGTGALHPGVNYATAAQPHRLVLADLNGDGRLDIATANRSSNSVSVLYGNGTVPGVGDGTFAAKVDFAVAGGPYSIAAGHLNGDSLMDLVVGTADDRSVKVLYRQAADGSYPVGETFAWGTREVMAVAVGDLNADTRADIVAVQEYGTNVRRWHQQAGGGFAEGPTLNFGENTYEYSVTLQDLNGDGRLDVITGGYYYFTVFENLGGGAFASPVTPGGGNSHVYQVAVGDLNGDNRLDLVGAMYNKTTLRVFLGRGPEILPADGAGFLGKARGNLSTDSDVDAFSFSAKAGDRVFVTSESFPRANSTGLLYRIYRPEGGEYTNFYGNANPSNGNDGTGQTQFVAPVSGVYYVRAEQWHGYRGEYRIAVAVHAGTYDLESESNNQANQADALNWSQEAGPRTASVGGIINFGDPGDWYQLGYLDDGTQITLNASKHAPNGLTWILDVMNNSGGVVISAVAGEAALQYTIPVGSAGTYHARIRASSGADMFARYQLALTLADVQKPTITASTLPAEGSSVINFFGDFTLDFSETLQAPTVNNGTNYDFRSAGPNGEFDDGDDVLYTIATASAYGSGLSATYRVTDGPPQPGKYRFQAKTSLLDLYGNALAAVYTRTFTVVGVEGYVFESRSNNTLATATSMAASGGEGAGPGFTWRGGVEFEAGNNPIGVALADFDGDGKLDAVTSNYNGGNIGVMKGNGDGTFGAATLYASPNNPFHVAVADLNGDTKPDVVVTRYNGSAVMVFLNKNDGTGALHPGVNYATAAQPHRLVLADLNGDGRLDIATANRSSNSVSVLYGNGTVPGVGDGTFAAKVDFAVAGGPYSIAAGHLNGDSLMDLVVGTADDRSVKVLYRQAADGSYPVGETFAWGTREVMAVAVGDLNADTRADIVAVQEYGTNVRRWHQQAGGGFAEGPTLNFGENTYEYSVTLQDLNGDGRLDVITGGYYYFTVFENLGGGAFASPVTPGGGNSHVYQVAVGDLNGDNRLDLVGAMYNKTTLRVFLGRGPETLPVDGAGFLGRARGNLSVDSDVDAFSFSAKAGDRVFVTSESFPRANSTGLLYRIYRPEGGEYTNFYGNANPSNGNDGTGQTQFVAPVSGVYYVRAEQWHGYRGEYRIAVAVVPGTFDLESESNNQANQADALNWTQTAGSRTAAVGGIINFGDPGDWHTLAFLDEGTQVTLTATKPASSGLSWILELMNSAGGVVFAVPANQPTLQYTIPEGGAGTYHARIRASSGADMFARYHLALTLTDTRAPTLASSTLPGEGTSINALFDRFSLTFSKEMEPSTVNNLGNYDLRTAGTDGIFDTLDDVIVQLSMASAYSSGLTASLRTTNGGPLPTGTYRFRALSGLQDKFLNGLTPVFTRLFSVSQISGYAFEAEPNGTKATGTALPLSSSQPDLFGAGGRGFLLNGNEIDFWNFELQAGDRFYIQGETPGDTSSAGLNYQILNPTGTSLASLNAPSSGVFAFGVLTAAEAGTYSLRVAQYYSYAGEYRFRVYVLRGGLQVEVEPNNTIPTATAMTLATEGASARGSIQGLSRTAGDLDYISLGTIQAGTTLFLSCRLPSYSTFVPVVSVYFATGSPGELVPETGGGRAGDAVAQVAISVTGVYYALVRTSGATSGLDSEYVLDVLSVPTADISFPNLQVVNLSSLPATGLKSGDKPSFTFEAKNVGNLATAAVSWLDRVVLSSDLVYGNADDLEVGVFTRSGPLGAEAQYSVTGQLSIPDGVAGDYYVIVKTDHTNTVNEFVLEGDNETAAETTIAITRADYPDLVVENLAVSDPDLGGQRTATWTLANRGLGAAAEDFSERFVVRNTTTATTVVSELLPVPTAIAAGATVARQATFTTTTAGQYQVEVTADAQSQRYEYNDSGPAAAEINNVASVPFAIIQLYTLAVAAEPVAGGTVAGGGVFAEGSSRAVTATPNAPYIFIGWFEGPVLRSINTTYTSALLANRTLTARFALPTFAIATQVSPAGGGVVVGGGIYSLGAPVSLTATPAPGFRFEGWFEGAESLGAAVPLAFSAGANRNIRAGFAELNPTHVVSTATSPEAVATITGAGTFNNGASTTITAPPTVVSGDTEYVFVRFLLNGAPFGTAASFSKTFSTLDPAAMAFVAEYRGQPLKPSVVEVRTNLGNLVGLTGNYQITLRFDRAMNQAVKPLVELTTGNAGAIPAVPAAGTWTAADTYQVPPLTIGATHGGTFAIRVSGAQDTQARAMDPKEVYTFNVDVAPPELPVLTAGAVTGASAGVEWSAYVPPSDLASFRVYRSSTTFTSLDGLSPLSSLGSAVRTYNFGNLELDTDYFVAVVPVDTVGNAATTVSPFTVRIASSIPPAVVFTVEATSTNAARLNWTYDPTALIGFSGFQVYRSSTAFSSLAGLTPIATLASNVRTFAESGLNRAQTHHYVVVGVNRLGQSISSVTSKPWTDPLSGTLVNDFTAVDPVLIITQPLTIGGGATFSIPAGTVIAFGPGANLTVESGRVVADGTIFAPVIFTSLADLENGSRSRGAWNGITLADPDRASTLRNVWVKYGKGVTVAAGSHTIDTLGAAWNEVAGLRLTGAVSLSTQRAYFSNNAVGVSIEGGATLNLTGSVLRNNQLNAAATDGGAVSATGNWWGTSDAGIIAASVTGSVNTASPLGGEPILTSGLRSADGAATTGLASLPLHLAAMNAVAYRVSEDSNFTGVLFVDVPRDPLSGDLFNTKFWPVTATLSPGSGQKTLYAQFRSPTGEVSTPLSFTTNYVTAGPVIAAFSLTEGQVVNRPINVTATVTSVLPLTSIKLFVDDVEVGTAAGSPFSTRWDMRAASAGVHRVRLTATDNAGNLASRNLNVVVNPTPPPRPVITAPASGTRSNTNVIAVTGTAEPLSDIEIVRNGSVVARVVANAAGLFSAPAVSCVEGTNEIVAAAVDLTGSTASTSVFVNVDSGPPAAVVLLPIVYNNTDGLFVDWDLPASGEVPVSFRVYWHTAPFSSVSEATGQSTQTLRSSINLREVPDGLKYFAVVGYDETGNASALSNVQSFQVDLTPPAFAITYSQAMPIGPGNLGITVTASEALTGPPVILMRPQGGSLVAVNLTAAGTNTYTASFPVTTLVARTGTAAIGITGTDLAGNSFTGPPAGAALTFDLTKPTGVLTTSVAGPIQTSSDVPLTVSLILSELPKVGTVPTLSFSPPAGSAVPVALSGGGLNWSGQLTVRSAMESGFGTFLLSVEDAVGNVGTVLTVGEKLELYNTPTPSPAAVPGEVTVLPLKGGYIRVSWAAADRAQSYRVYREPGASAAVPAVRVHEGIAGLTVDDLPPADGAYRYAVTSYRLGAESGPSGVRATTSDRTPPPAPTATTASLGPTGIRVAWTPAAGETPAKWVVYRNGSAITTLNNVAVTSFVDSPPRGVMTYAVAAADTLGNEARGPDATLELFVGAVTNFRAVADPAVGTALSWTSSDVTGVGYNIYRNGTRQNATPQPGLAFTDALPSGGQPVTYSVTAVNASGQESARRTVVVQPLTATVRLNPADAGDQASVARYFDKYSIAVTLSASASEALAMGTGEIIRAVVGETAVQAQFPLPSSIPIGETRTIEVVVPAPNTPGAAQGASVALAAATDAGGSAVQYRMVQDFVSGVAPGLMMTVSADAPPLAGGLSDFNLQVFNRGYAPADLVLTRGGNTQPGDLELQIISASGVLISSTQFQGVVAGSITSETGESFLRVQPGAAVAIPFRGVLVPEGLGDQSATFRARYKVIYNALGTTQQRVAGPLEGSMSSSLRVTPYYGRATVAQPVYSDNQSVQISGQAIDRISGLPVPNVPLRLGIRVRGAVLYHAVTTDGTGAFQFSYTPTPGLAGDMTIWAAHPDVVDQLDQARVTYYRMFTRPGRVEATMSKNDSLDFDIALLNPGDRALNTPAVSFRAFRMEGNTEVPISTLTGIARAALPASIGAQAEAKAALRLQAALDAPDDAQFEFTFTSAEGASTKLAGTVSFRPALAVLSTVSPTTGYAEAGVGKGQVKSVEVTVQNRGLRPLTGVSLVPPASVPWMQVQAGPAPDQNGNIPLPDIPIGGSRSFTVIFAPPAATTVGFYSDFLLIKGTNAVGDYRLNLFATVTSQEKGAVRFTVSNTFSNPVPNTSIWMRNSVLGTEIGPVLTDANGEVLVSGLMDGDWQWKTSAPGHGATQGVVTIVPDQTVGVETELQISMVTVKFSVVPVPFTDYYEIKIEQTFQTRTPIPNLIMTPPHQSLQVEAGWSGTLLYTLRNEGLRSLFDVNVSGANLPTMRATPLVSFIPELRAQESIQVPVFFEYFGPVEESGNQVGGLAGVLRSLSDSSAGGKLGDHLTAAPARAAAASSVAATPGTAAGIIDDAKDIYDCYKEFKYGTITLKAAAFVDSVSGNRYTVGVNATIDVDELLALVCDGECPESWTGGGILGTVANKACSKIVGKIVEKVSKKTKVIDIVCKAANIIKALACAATKLPSSTSTITSGGGGPGGGGGYYGGPGGGGGWTITGAGCFAEGTQVSLADGSTKPIELVQRGDRLLAGSGGGLDAVAQTMLLQSDHLRELRFRVRGAAAVQEEVLRLTHDHRVWVDGRGWIFSVDVQPGDWLHGANGELREVTGNERLPGRHPVYGLQMERDRVLYAAGILAEDQCFKPSATMPVALQKGGAQ
jgi:hypothetical protein